jgi:hypothetical protein
MLKSTVHRLVVRARLQNEPSAVLPPLHFVLNFRKLTTAGECKRPTGQRLGAAAEVVHKSRCGKLQCACRC